MYNIILGLEFVYFFAFLPKITNLLFIFKTLKLRLVYVDDYNDLYIQCYMWYFWYCRFYRALQYLNFVVILLLEKYLTNCLILTKIMPKRLLIYLS